MCSLALLLSLLLPFAPPHPLLARRPAACLPGGLSGGEMSSFGPMPPSEQALLSLPLCTIDFDIPRYIPDSIFRDGPRVGEIGCVQTLKPTVMEVICDQSYSRYQRCDWTVQELEQEISTSNEEIV